MDWNTLLSVAVGGLIATIGSIINNRFQAKERDKDRDEKRKEAKIQTREKWIERDILKIMDSLEQIIGLLTDVNQIAVKFRFVVVGYKSEMRTKKAIEEKAIILDGEISNKISEVNRVSESIRRLVYSLQDEKIYLAHKNFREAFSVFMQEQRVYVLGKFDKAKGKSVKEIDIKDSWRDLNRNAGELHEALRNKLISLRDT